MLISLVVAIADNGVIGRAGGLPWHLPDDLQHFRALTLGKSVLMGRRTFESIGRPLPGRQNLVLSHTLKLPSVADLHVVATLAQALACAQAWPCAGAELCVIGGAEIYALVLPYAGRIHLTQVHANIPGDVYFPGYQPGSPDGESIAGWRESARVGHPPDARHAHAMSFVTLDRTAAPATL
jgi:dihydrofolate reductase